MGSVRCTVLGHMLTDNAKVIFQKKTYTCTLYGDLTFRSTHRLDGEHQNSYLANINAFDYDYGLNASCRLMWNIQLATDFSINSHRGYSDSSMNTDEVLWNLSLSRSILKEKLLLRLWANDLLAQRSNFTYTVNAQGRIETWSNSIGRYIMLSLQWKFNKNPKKKDTPKKTP